MFYNLNYRAVFWLVERGESFRLVLFGFGFLIWILPVYIYLASSRKLPIDGESSKIAQSGCIHHCQKSQIETHAEISHGQIANQKSWNVHFASGSYQNNHNTSVSCWKQNIVKLVVSVSSEPFWIGFSFRNDNRWVYKLQRLQCRNSQQVFT